MISKLRN
jgi:hypothetical protein